MNKIEKFLRSLSLKEKQATLLLLKQLERDPFKVPGIIALKGFKGLYRVRMGRNRIIFFFDPTTKTFEVKHVGRRNEKTYKHLG